MVIVESAEKTACRGDNQPLPRLLGARRGQGDEDQFIGFTRSLAHSPLLRRGAREFSAPSRATRSLLSKSMDWRVSRGHRIMRCALLHSPRSRETFMFALMVACYACPLAAAERFSVSMPAWVGSLNFSPDGKQIAVGCADSSSRVLDAATGNESVALRGHEDYVASVAFSPDGKTLATGSYDRTARLWGIESNRPRQTLSGHRGAVMSVAFSPDGKWLSTGSLDTTVKLWNTTTGKLRATLSGHTSWVNSVVFSADGQWLVSGSSDGTIRLWRVRSGKPEATLNAADSEVRSVAISPDGKTLAAGVRYGALKTWNLATRREQFSIKAHESDVWSLAFSPGGHSLVSGDGDWNKPGEVKVWDTTRLRLRQTFATSGEVLSVACSPDGRTIAAGCADGSVKEWAVEDELR